MYKFIAAALGIISIITLALSLRIFSLGEGEDYFLYYTLGTTRTNVFLIGLLILALSALVAIKNILVSRLKTLVPNLLIIIVSFILSFMVVECGLRWVDGIPIYSVRNWLADRSGLLTTQTMNDYDNLLGWVLKPEMSHGGTDPISSFTTGKYGIRLNFPGQEIVQGGILASGDSFTAGSEVGDGSTWPAHLERMISQPVVNSGTGGWGADQIILRAESLLPIIKPKLIIISFYEDDIKRAGYSVYGNGNKPWFSIKDGILVHHNNPVPLFDGKFHEVSPVSYITGHSWFLLKLVDELEKRVGLSPKWQLTKVNYKKAPNNSTDVSCLLLMKAKHTFNEQNIPWIFLMQYGGDIDHAKKERPQHVKDILNCIKRNNINFIDIWDDLSLIQKRSFDEYISLFVSYDGKNTFGHMSSLGNKLVAELIASHLKK